MDIPKELIEQIAKGQAVAFVGAGLSQGAGLPGWSQLLKKMVDWGVENGIHLDDREELDKYIDSGELLLVAAELLERFEKKTEFHLYMIEVFKKSKPKERKLRENGKELSLVNMWKFTVTGRMGKFYKGTWEKSNREYKFHPSYRWIKKC